jgi:hypothetical protein
MSSLENKKHELLFTARLNVNYYEHAESFYTNVISTTVFMSLLLSSSTFAVLGDVIPVISPYKVIISSSFAAIVTVMNALLLAFNIQAKANSHGCLRRQWVSIYADIMEIDLGHLEEEEATRLLSRTEHESNKHQISEHTENNKWANRAYEMTCKNMGLKEVPPVAS